MANLEKINDDWTVLMPLRCIYFSRKMTNALPFRKLMQSGRRTRRKNPVPEPKPIWWFSVVERRNCRMCSFIGQPKQGLKVALIHDRPCWAATPVQEIQWHTLGCLWDIVERILKKIWISDTFILRISRGKLDQENRYQCKKSYRTINLYLKLALLMMPLRKRLPYNM